MLPITRPVSSDRSMGAILRVALLVLLVAASIAAVTPSAEASTTRTISGKVTCAKGNLSYGSRVVGVWVRSSRGGSKWATVTRSATYPNIANFSAKVTTSASSTTIRLDIGCGGTRDKWASTNSTPGLSVSGSRKGLRVKCNEATGSRAQRCSFISSRTCSAAYGVTYPISASNYRLPFPNVPVFKNYNGTNSTMTMSPERTTSGSVSYSVAAGGTAEMKAVLWKAQVSVSASLTTTNSSQETNAVSFAVPAKRYGNARYVSYGKKVVWSKKKVNSTCSASSRLASGTLIFPTSSEGWYTWISES